MAYHINVSDFSGLGAKELRVYTEDRIVDVSAITAFKDISPSVERMTLDNNAMSHAEAVVRRANNPVNIKARDEAVEVVVNNHRLWAQYIADIAGDNLSLIEYSGYTVAVEATTYLPPSGIPPTPKVLPSENPGEVRIIGKPYDVKKDPTVKCMYEMSTDGIDFRSVPPGKGGSRRSVQGLELNVPYWFRLVWYNNAGAGVPSDAAQIVLTRSLAAGGHKFRAPKRKAKTQTSPSTPAPTPKAASKPPAK